ncbi:MAG: hypothetical protein LCI02_05035 [Proteobacteria bacterium]|nr:hypothetical protein [Pseudomonadota bacterium]
MSQQQPIAFETVIGPDGTAVASNGQLRVIVPGGSGGRLFRRRGLRGLAMKTAAEQLVPQLNALAGELLQHPGMPAQEAVGRLLALAGTVHVDEPQRVEWVVAELNGVRVYADGVSVIVTTQDLTP